MKNYDNQIAKDWEKWKLEKEYNEQQADPIDLPNILMPQAKDKALDALNEEAKEIDLNEVNVMVRHEKPAVKSQDVFSIIFEVMEAKERLFPEKYKKKQSTLK